MQIRKGEVIREIRTGKLLEVNIGIDGEVEKSPSRVFDFMASYQTPAGRSTRGALIYGNRGFSFKDEGTEWERVNG